MPQVILIVEDTDVCRDALEVALMGRSRFEVRCVATVEEALQQLRDASICALITDLHFRDMDGFDLIQAVRSQSSRSSIPILVISGDSDPGTPARVASLGANAYFPKPYSPAEVRNKLEELLHGL